MSEGDDVLLRLWKIGEILRYGVIKGGEGGGVEERREAGGIDDVIRFEVEGVGDNGLIGFGRLGEVGWGGFLFSLRHERGLSFRPASEGFLSPQLSQRTSGLNGTQGTTVSISGRETHKRNSVSSQVHRQGWLARFPGIAARGRRRVRSC